MGISTVGKDLMLQRLGGITATAINSMGVGSSNTAFAATQTALQGTYTALQALDAGSPTEASEVLTCTCTFSTSEGNLNGGASAWEEIGLFNGTTNGTSTMFNRIVIPAITKTSAISIVAVIQITQS